MAMHNWQQSFIELLLPTGHVWKRALDRIFRDAGLNASAAGPLLIVQRLGDGVRQAVIAHEAGVDHAAMVRSLQRLEAAGLVLRQPDPGDRRGNLVALTVEGRAKADRLLGLLNAFRDESFVGIKADEGEAAVRVIGQLLGYSRSVAETGVAEAGPEQD